jgi:hypothetical protein
VHLVSRPHTILARGQCGFCDNANLTKWSFDLGTITGVDDSGVRYHPSRKIYKIVSNQSTKALAWSACAGRSWPRLTQWRPPAGGHLRAQPVLHHVPLRARGERGREGAPASTHSESDDDIFSATIQPPHRLKLSHRIQHKVCCFDSGLPCNMYAPPAACTAECGRVLRVIDKCQHRAISQAPTDVGGGLSFYTVRWLSLAASPQGFTQRSC